MDPPWRIKGGQQFDSQFMFSNSKFSLDYDTMSNKEIMDIPVEKLSKKGFLFLWILNTQMDTAKEMMQKWGYNLVDKIVWVKMKDKNVYLSHGYYFMHSFELCLIGYKNEKDEPSELYPAPVHFNMIDEKNLEENKIKPTNRKNEYNKPNFPQFFNKISNNVIFAEVRKKSQKPDEFYEIMDMMIPGAKKIELFARNNNLRPGWVSVGNQLGETYEKWMHQVVCDHCHLEITKGKFKRYKSRRINNYDICENCVEKFERNDFYEIQNKVNEDILHNYQSCNRCEAEPIWGIRFHCTVCKDYDLCEACVDENTKQKEGDQFHDLLHDMKIIEVPVFADGFPVHDRKCQSCFQSPIIGTCFTCKQCSGNFNLCQNCFFSKPMEMIKNKRHKPEHQMDALITPIKNVRSKKNLYKCSGCGIINLTDMYKCESCYGFYFCIKCYETKRDDFKTYMASSHKNYHSLIRYNLLDQDQQEAENQRKAQQQTQLTTSQNSEQANTYYQDKQNITDDKDNSDNIDKFSTQIIPNSDDLQKQNISNKHKSYDSNEYNLESKQIDDNEKMELEQTDNLKDDDEKNKSSLRLNKNGKSKRQYNRKQKKDNQTENTNKQIKENIKEVTLESIDEEKQKEDNSINIIQKILENNLYNNKHNDKYNLDIEEEKENIQEENDENSRKQVASVVKQIRKKRESKKMKGNVENKKEVEEKDNEVIIDKQDQIQETQVNDESNNNQDIEQNDDEKIHEENSNDQAEENQNGEQVQKKRKRRKKEEIEKDNLEKERQYQQYLKNVELGLEKKKRGRVSKKLQPSQTLLPNETDETVNKDIDKKDDDSDQQNQNEIEQNNEEDSSEQKQNDVKQNKEEQIDHHILFKQQQDKYIEKLSIDEMAIKTIDASNTNTTSSHITVTYDQIIS